MKTVTKEQVEKAVLNNRTKEEILNELFPEFKVGDWVVGWHHEHLKEKLHQKAWQIGEVDEVNVCPVGMYPCYTFTENIRRATPEEIEAATWKEGELYRVKHPDTICIRVSTKNVGEFYNYGYYDGTKSRYDTYEKLNTCSCGFCVKEKEG